MDFMTAIDIGASALNAERTNMNIISMNLANVKTTRTEQGGPYRRKTTIMAAQDIDDPFAKHMQGALDRELKGVRVMHVATDSRPLKRVYEPGHPDADQDGFVAYPDINVVEEMASLMTAQRGYEANVTTIDTVKAMYTKALEISR
ncbi:MULTISPECIES: flagellar basal body rod protein FlgC [Nitratidesulfovibrio]|mgnify:FL=1|uniref:Flagellar basal-body rod protein FlgC n=2 Tax=Nitratidesulfovibrio TaxID=2802295 RepID=B8DQV8_NITV9|nr:MULTISPECIES: flagellar basal body rod protein FlgC [Nitratidesulfovibrio]MBG3876243.1 flagellar basal body rod protein FlgC [Nitratidesulfovibrio oxamicus]MBZ2170450.1 flagellar basal body rod protein FlgC [Nitratidesulfovibrio sp. SRB-5]RXF78219.1 flagellar basal body rod protein FlgC [Desulfovibrio sp. DS-1]